MFRIKWRNRYESLVVVEGLSRYDTSQAAEKQVAIFQLHFRDNSYYVEPV